MDMNFTIPVNEAFETDCECPFCALERTVEQKAIRYTLGPGASYMEPDVRGTTDRLGFCSHHMKKMFDYGNTLGNAWILKTHYKRMLGEMRKEFKSFAPGKVSLKDKLFKNAESGNSIGVCIKMHKKTTIVLYIFSNNLCCSVYIVHFLNRKR